jgi:muramoyltetrapeptide carboxypeptidase LdcA involved in peptidoglycan recycling
MIRPRALRPGGTIGVVAPSWCGPALHPRRVERGVRFLESLGYRVVLGRHAMGGRAEIDTSERRLAILDAAVAG